MEKLERLMLRPAEFAEAIGVSRSKGYEILGQGDVASVKVGSCVRVPVSEVKRWIERQLAERAEAGR
jgi:excisionase family DNA binding protein